jgi:ATP/maltotriose-dependent transcriptional regulator MalT
VLAEVQKARGHYDDAVQAFLVAIPALEQSEEVGYSARARSSLAEIFLAQGRFVEAIEVIQQGMAHFENEGGANLALMKVSYSEILIELGEYVRAQEQLDSLGELATKLESEDRPYYDYVRGHQLAVQRDAEAVNYLTRAAMEGNASISGRANVALGRALIERSMVGAARTLLVETRENARKTGHREVQASAALGLAEMEIGEGSLPKAQELMFEAFELADGFQGRLLLRGVHQNRVLVAQRQGDTKAAEESRRELGALLEWLLDHIPAQHRESFRAKTTS